MALTQGTRLGPYEILSTLGAGGMGEVYRARDTRLGREVAVKVLPDHLSSNPEIRQRFEREAKAVSSLNHPHICTLFDIGHQDGVHFLVMELLEGETLADRLKRGVIPWTEALPIGAQIADALEKAHRAGFVHRDLKPGNVMLSKAGAKLLDFGLARALAGDEELPGGEGVTGSAPASTTPTAALRLTASPAADTPLTTQGSILGTIQYMAPEQLDGRDVDERTDIFAFGLVLYEMMAGQRAFVADSQAGLIAEIMKGEPRSLSEIVPASPPAMDRLIRACLRKDPDERIQSAHDVRLQMEWISEAVKESSAGPGAVPAADGSPTPRSARRLLPWILAGFAVLAALVGWMNLVETRAQLSAATRPVAFSVRSPSALGDLLSRFSNFSWSGFAISPDGRRIAFAFPDEQGVAQLWVRDLGVLEPRLLPGTQDARDPFWSPDSRTIGFHARDKLLRIDAEGGPVRTVCDWRSGAGGSWNENGIILFGGGPGEGIMRVPAAGGAPEPVGTAGAPKDRRGERLWRDWPTFLPGGDRFLYLQHGRISTERAVFVGSLDGTEPRELLRTGFKAGFIEPDWLVFVRGISLMAQRLDTATLELLGEPRVIIDAINLAIVPADASFSVSPAGHLAFRMPDRIWRSQLRWYSRDGNAGGMVSEEAAFVSVSIAPDGRTASVTKATGGSIDTQGMGEPPLDIWNIDLARGIMSRFTSRPTTSDENPVWSPDGSKIAYASHENGPAEVFLRDARGAGNESILFTDDSNPHPIDWSHDGRYLMIQSGGNLDLRVLDLEHPEARPIDYLTGPDREAQGQFSPDGRWVAYASDESGQPEVFVRSFPVGEGKWQISSHGGDQPRWRADGREIYYVAPDGTLMVVAIAQGQGFHASAPEPLFVSQMINRGFFFYGAQAAYDVTPDGQRFLVNRDIQIDRPDPSIEVILNWPRPDKPSS